MATDVRPRTKKSTRLAARINKTRYIYTALNKNGCKGNIHTGVTITHFKNGGMQQITADVIKKRLSQINSRIDKLQDEMDELFVLRAYYAEMAKNVMAQTEMFEADTQILNNDGKKVSSDTRKEPRVPKKSKQKA